MANDCWGPDTDDKALKERGEVGMPAFGSPGRLLNISMPEYEMRITQRGISVNYGMNGYDVDAVTADAEYILAKVLPGLLSKFLEKNEKYAEVEKGYDLGDKGIIPDLNRKLGILVARIWHGAPEVGEDTDEVIDDLIGHLLLMRAKRGRARK